MKEQSFYEVVSAIAQFIEKADRGGEDYHEGLRLTSPVGHDPKSTDRANPAITGSVRN